MSRVFVTQRLMFKDRKTGEMVMKFDLQPAEKFGEVIFLTEWNSMQAMAPQPLIQDIRRRLKGFNNEDYLLPIGNPVVIGMATAIALEENIGQARIMLWDRQDSDYLIVNCNMRG